MVSETFVYFHYYQTLLGVQSYPGQKLNERLRALEDAARCIAIFDHSPTASQQPRPATENEPATEHAFFAILHSQYQKVTRCLPHLWLSGGPQLEGTVAGQATLSSDELWNFFDIRPPPTKSGTDTSWKAAAAARLAEFSSKCGVHVPETMSGNFDRAEIVQWRDRLWEHKLPHDKQTFCDNEIDHRLEKLKGMIHSETDISWLYWEFSALRENLHDGQVEAKGECDAVLDQLKRTIPDRGGVNPQFACGRCHETGMASKFPTGPQMILHCRYIHGCEV
ncbi:hypothetical protein CKAH01_11555 [Colletotrichum kahawae]|uniref:Uncharacterized protein n=1 Tax=Colletotrichum kahawae TaxID=34407 RepID=A0AAD9YVY7_COLKA|nr:hypothetical protein CKAH01_11555 [Colletotrichum kahawae]